MRRSTAVSARENRSELLGSELAKEVALLASVASMSWNFMRRVRRFAAALLICRANRHFFGRQQHNPFTIR